MCAGWGEGRLTNKSAGCSLAAGASVRAARTGLVLVSLGRIAFRRAASWEPADGSRRCLTSAGVLQRWRLPPPSLEARVRRLSLTQEN